MRLILCEDVQINGEVEKVRGWGPVYDSGQNLLCEMLMSVTQNWTETFVAVSVHTVLHLNTYCCLHLWIFFETF